LGYLKKRNPNGNMSVQINNKRSNKKQKGHASASPASSTPFTLDSVSLGQDSESLTNQDRLNGQKTIKK